MLARHALTGLAVALAVAPACALTTQVKAIDGVPRLIVSGSSVIPRVFFGFPGHRAIALAPNDQTVTAQFRSIADSQGHGEMHIRFGTVPADISILSVCVQDTTTGTDVVPPTTFDSADRFDRDWQYWPSNDQNKSGTIAIASTGVVVSLHAPLAGRWSDTHIFHRATLDLRLGREYKITMTLRSSVAQRLDIAFYRPRTDGSYEYLGGVDDPFPHQIKLAAAAGVNIVSFPITTPWPYPGDAPDFSPADNLCRYALAANPSALLLLRIGCHTPRWWLRDHPDAVMTYDGKQYTSGPQPTIGSEAWRAAMAANDAALVAHLEQSFGEHILGYHITGEWFTVEASTETLFSDSPDDTADWRKWLADRYATDAVLQAAWHSPSAAIVTADIPSPAARRSAVGELRDPAAEPQFADWALYEQQTDERTIAKLARAIKAACGRRKVVACFYGYAYELAACPLGAAVAGHYALRDMLNNPDIDMLCAPLSYFDRGAAQSQPLMPAVQSIALAGKLYFGEDDTSTYLSSGDFAGWQVRAKTPDETDQLLRRNTALVDLENLGTWWMDLGGTGWFDDPLLWRQLSRTIAIQRDLLLHSTPYEPEVASVIDERSMQLLAPHNAIGENLVKNGRFALGRMGAPYGQYLLDDVLAGRTHAKLYVFEAVWRLSPQERIELLDRTRGTVRLWCYGSGCFDGVASPTQAMSQLTGFHIKAVAPDNAAATPTDAGRKLGLTAPIGIGRPPRPTYAVDADAVETLATFPNGSAAIALRRTPDGASLFVGVPKLTPDLLRLAARIANVHLYTHSDAVVFANGPYVAVHATQSGPIELDLPTAANVADVISGEPIGRGKTLNLPIAAGQTRILHCTP